MSKADSEQVRELIDHFFRNEYGKMVAVISKYLGSDHIETAEDLVQETLKVAMEYWPGKGVPPNPSAWLYTTAKNKTLNFLRKRKFEKSFQHQHLEIGVSEMVFSEEQIMDEQLSMMLRCCRSSISNETKVILMLKILCGFSISEIASAFCSNKETINKSLVRGRKKMKNEKPSAERVSDLTDNLDVLLKTIYLLFNEGYFPSRKNQIVRQDLCFEAIRLAEILVSNPKIENKENVQALLALMYLNAARFEARTSNGNEPIEMENQDRSIWDQKLINKGLFYLNEARKNDALSSYLILAGISANHCVSHAFENTSWQEILSLYDALLCLEDTAVVRLNRIVVVSEVYGAAMAISEMEKVSELADDYFYHVVMGRLYNQLKNHQMSMNSYRKALFACDNERDKAFLNKKINELVPILNTHV